MSAITTTFEFEELSISLFGKPEAAAMFHGKATLESEGGEYREQFYVSEIELDGGTRLNPTGAGYLGFPNAFECELFKRIAAVIENDLTAIGNHAAREWASHLEYMKEAA
jgi:hypothetical protein